MVKAITPFSTRAKEGATDAPLGDFVKVEQEIISTATAGFYDKNTGKLEGVIGSDKLFTVDATHESVANGGAVLSPQATPQYIDMTGFSDLLIGIRVTNTGNCAISAVMGPNDLAYANLREVNPASNLRGCIYGMGSDSLVRDLFIDSSETLTADVWNIFSIQGVLANQKLLQFSITNNTGGPSNIQFASLRVV